MGFNAKNFMEAQFEARTRDFPVPQLKEWFDAKDKPVWKIRSLTGAEIGLADEQAEQRPVVEEIIDAISAKSRREVGEQVKKLIGNTADKTKSMAKRIYMLQYGSVEPECPLDMAVRFCDNFPSLFLEITNAILLLSGQGNVAKKK